jgi:CRISPR-associated protein Csd1
MLHALKEYADSIGLSAEPGFKSKEVKWLILFDDKGKYVNVQRIGDGKSGVLYARCPHLTQPELKSGGAGCRHFLVDGLDVIVLRTTKGDADKKLLKKHAFFVDLLRDASGAEASLEGISKGLADEKCLEKISKDLDGFTPKAKPGDLATFAVLGGDGEGHQIIVQNDTWHDWWREFRVSLKKKKKAAESRLCFLTGVDASPASTHPKITGLASVGGMAAGDVYASFKQASFQSYGLSQSENAAMSEDAAKLYTTTLNNLIREKSERLASSRIVFWYFGTKEIPAEFDPLQLVLGGSQSRNDDDEQEEETQPSDREIAAANLSARKLLTSIRSSNRADLLNLTYRAMTVSANSGRVVVRDWMEGQFESFVENVDQWFNDLRITKRDGSGVAPDPKFLAVLGGTVRDLKDATAPSEVALWQAAVRGSPIPSHLAASALARFRIDLIQDRPTRHAQVGLMKAFLVRLKKEGSKHMPELTTELNEQTDNPAYVSGRILALLGQIQKKAIPSIKVGVIESYYASASVSPGLILGRLIRTALIAHLPKIKPDPLRHWFDNQLSGLIAILNESPKRTLTMEEQTLFALGYYQQRAKRSKSADTDAEATESTEDKS